MVVVKIILILVLTFFLILAYQAYDHNRYTEIQLAKKEKANILRNTDYMLVPTSDILEIYYKTTNKPGLALSEVLVEKLQRYARDFDVTVVAKAEVVIRDLRNMGKKDTPVNLAIMIEKYRKIEKELRS